MNFNNFYFKSTLTSSIISLFLGINSVLGFPNIDKKIK